ncbi:helix-turn-helix domain-containing protein [Streptomyces thinghirensis]|nr:helix-turn-helix domain-containing protein [Streptomyces thinghirensis]
MRFNLIGPFEIVTDDGRIYRPGTPKVCQTLALLLTRPNEIITAESLIQELWGASAAQRRHHLADVRLPCAPDVRERAADRPGPPSDRHLPARVRDPGGR